MGTNITESREPSGTKTIDSEKDITISSTSSLLSSQFATRLSDPLKEVANSDEYTSVYVSSANSLKGSKEAESLVDGTRRNITQLNRSKTSSVKLTRSSPFTLATSSSTSILKGTPKPSVVVRKPPVL